MKADNADSGSNSGAASETKPPPPETPPEKLSESEYLAQQAEAATRAMAVVWAQMKGQLAKGVAPQAWAREFPWITVGAAAVAGFVAASTLIPSKEEQALKKLAAIERALHPAPPRTEHAADGNGHGKKEGGSILSTILHEVLAVARPALVSLMTAGLSGVMPPGEQQPQPEDGSGHGSDIGDRA